MQPERLLSPWWSLALPLVMTAVLMEAPEERRMWTALAGAVLFTAMQWMIPACRFRIVHYACPVNVALFLGMVKTLLLPAAIMLVGPETSLIPTLPAFASIEKALMVDVVAVVALCFGLSVRVRPSAQPGWLLRGTEPSRGWALIYVAVGLVGLLSAFGSPAAILDYYMSDSQLPMADPSLTGFLGTVLRPFLAFGVVAAWARFAQRHGPGWRSAGMAFLTIIPILFVNMTYGLNRAAFVFPILCLFAVYSGRVKRVSFTWFGMAMVAALPILIGIGMLRASRMEGHQKSEDDNWLQSVSAELTDNLYTYAGGQQLTAQYGDQIGWGEDLAKGTVLLGSIMTPVPVLGKSFRDAGGPIVYNKALYGINDITDQILPFDIELFANFHLPGVIAGYLLLGFVLARAEPWFSRSNSIFFSYCIQYAFFWVAMVTAWSIAILSQMVVYFFGPIYLYMLVRAASSTKSQPVAVPQGVAVPQPVAGMSIGAFPAPASPRSIAPEGT